MKMQFRTLLSLGIFTTHPGDVNKKGEKKISSVLSTLSVCCFKDDFCTMKNEFNYMHKVTYIYVKKRKSHQEDWKRKGLNIFNVFLIHQSGF